MQKTVVVGMSGGVDSSVSALLLKEQGYRVIALFMKNWDEEEESGACTATTDYEDVVKVCQKLDIPYYSVNFTKEYRDAVFSHFLNELEEGHTPNPDILCNREIKFKRFFDKAMELGADYLATGHYCQIGEKEGQKVLTRGFDPNKDQSYFLAAIDGKVLDKVLFPIGHLEKSEVRKIAEKANLPVAKKKDSTGICFIGKRDFSSFLHGFLPYQKGKMMQLDGTVVGEHRGVAYYTIGQRKGLGIGGPGSPWFVVKKNQKNNIVYVEQGDDHPELYQKVIRGTETTFISGKPPGPFPYRCSAKIRYRTPDAPCTILSLENGEVVVEFEAPQRAVTPRQSLVFYDGDICLGNAFIKPAEEASK